MGLKRKSLSGVLWVFAEQFGGQIIAFLASLVLARILYPEDFGIIAMSTLFIAIGTSFVDNGLTSSLIVSKELDEDDFSSVFYLNVSMGVAIYAALYYLAPIIAGFFETEILTEVLRVYTLVFVINSLFAVHKAILVKAMDFKKQFVITLPSLFLSALTGISLAYLGYSVWSLVYMYIVRSFFDFILYWAVVKWMPSFSFNINKAKRHFAYGIRITLSGLIHTIYMNLYNLIIGKFYAISVLGFYYRAVSTKDLLVNNLSTSLSRVLLPAFSEMKDDNVRLKSAYRSVSQQVFFFFCPILVLCIIVAHPLFEFLFTEKWLAAAPFFQILCIVGILTPIQSYNVNIIKAAGRADLVLRLELIKKPIFILGIFIAIKFGITALLWNHVISNLIGLFINSYYSGRQMKYGLYNQLYDLRHTILTTTASGFIGLQVYNAIGDVHVFFVLIVVALVFYGVYFFISILCKNPAYLEAYRILTTLLKRKNENQVTGSL